jgi:hypothetical protein
VRLSSLIPLDLFVVIDDIVVDDIVVDEKEKMIDSKRGSF